LLLQEEDIQLLVQIGFTAAQAKVYLSLLKTGKTDVKTLSKYANVPRQATYRTLGELQEKGICERILALPQEYEALPIQDGLSIMLNSKANEYSRILEKSRKFILKFNMQKKREAKEQEYKISIVEGKDTIIKKTKFAHDSVQHCVNCCSTVQRWIQVTQEIAPNIQKALDRGVRFRLVIENLNGEINLPKEIKALLERPSYKVKLTGYNLKSNMAIFDDTEASLNFYPSKTLAGSPMVWTNHPSLLTAFHDHFNNVWAAAQECPFLNGIK
jgi:sugar-specific transcriptional regulator TrmB